MARIIQILLAVCCCLPCYAEEPPKAPLPQVDVAEVYRRGDWVTVVGEGPRGPIEDAMIAATAPPPDDSHMWFVTVIKTENCQHCDKLISDFERAPELMAFIKVAEPYKPWGHFNVYHSKDSTQQWRLKAYNVTGFPTLVIQPPRNGMWGSPRTVVWQKTGYDGNPSKLAREITTAVRRFAAKMAQQGYPKQVREGVPRREQSLHESVEGLVIGGSRIVPPTQSSALPVSPRYKIPAVVGGKQQEESTTPNGSNDGGSGQFTPANQDHGVDPPFVTPPRVDPFNPTPMPLVPAVPVVIPGGEWPPPTPTPQPNQPSPTPDGNFTIGKLVDLISSILMSLLTGQGATNLLLLTMVGMWLLEWYAPKSKATWDDDLLRFLKDLQDRFRNNPPNPPGPAGPNPS